MLGSRRSLTFGLLMTTALLFPGQGSAANFKQRLVEARQQYFADLQGNRAAAAQARANFAALSRDYPNNAV
jgi:hypothetical protein